MKPYPKSRQLGEKKPKKIYRLKRSWIKKKMPKSTGQTKLFLEIWNERPHYCSNPNCRVYLGEEPRRHYFSHIKGKGKYRELMLDKNNIQLLCFDCHDDFDFRGKKRFK